MNLHVLIAWHVICLLTDEANDHSWRKKTMLHEYVTGGKIIVATIARLNLWNASYLTRRCPQIHVEPSQIIGNYVRDNERVNENK